MFKIGADPELFLSRNGEYISAETKEGPLIPGTKKKPFKVKCGAIQVDGVAAEFNINPATDADTFYNNIKSVLIDLNSTIREKDGTIRLTANPTATFKRRYFEALPEHTKELGCEPDYSAYTLAPNPRPSTTKPFRTASGHVHIGWTKNADPTNEGHMKDCQLVVQELDRYLYFASLDWDKDELRRELYGKPGAFRPKPYGVEYRTLSNAWLKSPKLIKTVFKLTHAVMQSIDSGRHSFKDPNSGWGETNTDKAVSCLSSYYQF